MSAPNSEQTTRTNTVTVAGGLLRARQVIPSTHAKMAFVIDRMLGRGGFGQVYLATVAGTKPPLFPKHVCVKVTTRLPNWICEAYFGFVLGRQSRAIHLYEAIPLGDSSAALRGLYALVLEYAQHGALADYLAARGRGWNERRVRQQMVALLEVLDVLHRGNALHRDLTPFNVFVCAGEQLKLGDFGIARHSPAGAVPAQTMARWLAPADVTARLGSRWRARDDVYQVGQLLGMLILGDATRRLTSADVRKLECSDHLKEIIQRCIGEARKRFQTAGELTRALKAAPRPRPRARVPSLAGKIVVFTGRLRVQRTEAARLARRAGAIVHRRVTAATDVLVCGIPSPVQKAGAKGAKRIDVGFWRERGVRVAEINETSFWRLVGSAST